MIPPTKTLTDPMPFSRNRSRIRRQMGRWALERIERTPASAAAGVDWSYFGLKDSKAFVAHARGAKALGHKEPTLLDYLARVEKGEPIK
jgi:hypothetical protein